MGMPPIPSNLTPEKLRTIGLRTAPGAEAGIEPDVEIYDEATGETVAEPGAAGETQQAE